jgi:DNA repair exonuclease SbcCD ATPase subunit
MELLFSNGIWLVLFLLLVGGAVGLYFLLRWGREKVQSEARQLSGELRAFENQHRQTLLRLEGFLAEDPEPYGSQAEQLHHSATEVGQQLYSLREDYISIQQRLPRRPKNAYQAGLVSPLLLMDLHSGIDRNRKGVFEGQADLARLDEPIQALEGLGWEIAEKARRANQDQVDLEQRLQKLKARHVHGQTFNDLARENQHLQEQFAQIPEYFMTASPEEVLSKAEKTAIIPVYQILTQTQPEIENLDRQFGEWEQRLVGLDEKNSRLRQESAQVEQLLDTLPAPIDSAGFKNEFNDLQTQQQRLQARIAHPELEQLAGLETTCDELQTKFLDLETALRNTRQGQSTLEYVLSEISLGMKDVSNQYSALGTAKSYRILWLHSSDTLANFSQQISQLGDAQHKRTPEKIEQDLETANNLALKQKEFAAYLQKISDQQAELTALLEGPELGQAMLWAQNTRKLLPDIQVYHADNWPRADRVNALPDELRRLNESLQSLGASRPAEGVGEEKIAQRLEDARRLGQEYQDLRSRVNVIEARLTELRQVETQARETLETTSRNLTQVGFTVNSNPFLVKIAGQDIERFQKQIEKQLNDLDQPQQGTVDSKARQAGGLAARIDQGLNEWLAQLDGDTQERVKALTASLTRLDSIAPLDEPAVAEARRLLSVSQPRPITAYAQRSQIPQEALVMEFKRRSEYNQSCAAVQKALEDLETPIVETYNTAQQDRQRVQDQFQSANNWLRQARSWPPVAVDVDGEYQALGRLEAEWAALKDRPVKAIDLVKRLGDMTRQYEALSGKMDQLIKRGNQEQKDIQRLEGELDRYLDDWEKLQSAYQDNPRASEDIHKLLDEADREMFRLKSQYKDNQLSYNQVQQSIVNLHRKVRLYQAVLDDTHVVDVNGKVIASRESQRAPGEW